ncbi:RHS repeat-associated core domain-containing protein [Pantoea sp. Ap-967]|uniref:RHS repeat-associated core domain-containing protein n=1 Tax=Pantoea sp. Ap-967 TaxID=2608362 RepID=UPI001966AE82|nr:RHS repeat-associated core domain-containing protein [Pantoea sp. Ap-967]
MPTLPAAASQYTAYGHHPRVKGSALAFNGERPDSITGCYHLGNGYRAYNCELMRFQAPDSLSPFGEGGLNAYAYCAGDPVNARDPTGHGVLTAALTLRGLGMGSNAATLAYNFLGPEPTNRVGLNASRMSTFGAVLSLGSSAAQFAGVETAVFGANVGTGITMTGIGIRAVNAAIGPGSQPLTRIRRNFQLLTSGIPSEQPAADIPLEGITVQLPRGVPVRASIVDRPRHEVRREPVVEFDPDAVERQSMGIRRRRYSM